MKMDYRFRVFSPAENVDRDVHFVVRDENGRQDSKRRIERGEWNHSLGKLWALAGRKSYSVKKGIQNATLSGLDGL